MNDITEAIALFAKSLSNMAHSWEHATLAEFTIKTGWPQSCSTCGKVFNLPMDKPVTT